MKAQNLRDTIERLQVCSSMDSGVGARRWLEILGVHQKEYRKFLSGQSELSDSSIQALAEYLDITPEEILSSKVDFRAVCVNNGEGSKVLPESYSIAAFGRRRTTITSFDFIENSMGWRTRSEILRKFRVNEAVLSDHMAPINMQFMTDVAAHLHSKHDLPTSKFFLMGAHSAVGNRNSLIGSILSTTRDITETFEMMFDELIKFFEQNTKYTIRYLDNERATIDVISYKHVAEALGVYHLGNSHICALKGGFLASIPLYIGLPLAEVSETQCVHRGDSICRYELAFDQCSRHLSDMSH